MTSQQEEQLTVLARKYADLTDTISRLQEQADQVKALIMADRPAGEYQAGTLTVKIKPGRKTLDMRRFLTEHTPADNPECYDIKPKPLSQLVRQLGEPALQDYIKTGNTMLVVE